VMMIVEGGAGDPQVTFNGLWYHDRIVRTARGWRFAERLQVYSWVHNAPRR
jgi:hypothetical protein